MLPSKPELLSAHSQNVAALLSLDTLGNRALLKASLLAAGLTDAQSSALCLTLPPPRPSQWPLRKKLTVLLGPYLAAALAAYSAGAYALAAAPLRAAWHVSETAYAVGITIFVSAFGFAPMVLAPVSEAHGRYWVFVGAGAVFFLGTLGCAVTAGYAGMLVSRFVTGMGASVFATLTGGVVADVYDREARNTPMALYSLMIMAGTGLGPLVSGVVVDALGWRWIFYLQMMLIAATLALILVLFEETRANVVLARLCHALNKQLAETHPASRLRFHPSVVQETLDIGLVYRSFVFPLRLLVAEPVVLCFSLWVSFAWAILHAVQQHRHRLPRRLRLLQPAGWSCLRRRCRGLVSECLPRHHAGSRAAPPLAAPGRLHHTGKSAALDQCAVSAATRRAVLVRVDGKSRGPLDLPGAGCRSMHHGHLQHLSRRLQLLGRHVWALLVVGAGGAEHVSQPAGGHLSVVYAHYAAESDVPRHGESPRGAWTCVDGCPVASKLFRAPDSGQESICQDGDGGMSVTGWFGLSCLDHLCRRQVQSQSWQKKRKSKFGAYYAVSNVVIVANLLSQAKEREYLALQLWKLSR